MKTKVTVRFVSGREEQFETDIWGGASAENRLMEFSKDPTLVLQTDKEIVIIPATSIESITIPLPDAAREGLALPNVRKARRLKYVTCFTATRKGQPMSTVGETVAPAGKSDDRPPGPSSELNPLTKIAACLVVAALSWYLLRELAALLRPLLLAVFLGYVILPMHWRLARTIPRVASVAVLVGGSVGLLCLLGLKGEIS